ncbi:MAG TPA: Wadjet anti-phage system protein JetD domain-containing protein [Clostridiaceae bacterium]
MKTVYDLEKKLLSITEIQEYFKIDSYLMLVELIGALVAEGVLFEVKSSKSNGMRPSLYNKYRVKPQEEVSASLEEDINYSFPIEFNREFYLNNLKKYEGDKNHIDRLSDYFRNYKGELSRPMSINERSFQIWGKEKFLKDGNGQSILRNLGLSLKALNIYTTPEPFVYFSCNKEKNQKVLIIENKDTWYTMRKLMLEGQREFLGERLDTIIYGNGKSIEKSLEEYEYTVEAYLLEPILVLYWGDIDYEGISIYERLKRRHSKMLNIELFINAYATMLKLAKGKKLQQYKEKQNKNIDKVFLVEITPYDEKIVELMELGLYIPQEIVNYSVLREDVKHV